MVLGYAFVCHIKNYLLMVFCLRPLIGGSLSDIALKFPTVFDYAVLKAYPYFLPCLVVAAINFAGMLSAYCFLQEVGSGFLYSVE